MRPILLVLFLVATIISTASNAIAADIYVSPTGNDHNDGSKDKPFQTLGRAQEAARRPKKLARIGLHGGTYYLSQPLVLTAEDSKTQWEAVEGETPVISGGVKLDLKWEPYKNGIMQAKVPEGFKTDQLFVNGVRQPMARYPNYNPQERIFNGYAKDAISPERVRRWADPKGGFIHAMHAAMWGGMHYEITGKDEKGNLKYIGGWQNNRPSGMHGEYRFVENVFEELDAPGEWFLNTTTNTLFYYLPPELDLSKATIEGVRLKHLVEMRGTKYVSLKGITFRHAARTFMENKEPLLRSDWTTYRGGAVLLEGTECSSLVECTFDQVGGNAVFINNFNSHTVVTRCHIAKAGGNGVALVGDPASVRNGIGWKEHNDYARIDKTRGPKSENYPIDCLIENCLIHETGRVEKQTAGVQIEMAERVIVRNCSIYDVPRAGINIGSGCWGGHVIENCDVFDTVLETGDHGSFNSWGRDRFWGLSGAPHDELPKLAMLDMVEPTIIRHNRWRCDHGWDVDLDDGSSYYEITNNLFLAGGLKLREGFGRKVTNNITVNNGFHPHVWFDNCGDVVTHNIWMSEYRPAGGMPPGKWGQEVDHNFFTVEKDRLRFAGNGCDANSLAGDPQFVDPAKGDFRVKEGSPALKAGFVNFEMDNFGVQSPKLKAIARTPSFAKGKAAVSHRDGTVHDWAGVKVKNIVGIGEMSAYAVPGETGVLVVEIPADHRLAKAGLQKGDVIQRIDGVGVTEVGEVLAVTRLNAMQVWRNQVQVDLRF